MNTRALPPNRKTGDSNVDSSFTRLATHAGQADAQLASAMAMIADLQDQVKSLQGAQSNIESSLTDYQGSDLFSAGSSGSLRGAQSSLVPSITGGFSWVAGTTNIALYWDGTNGSTPIAILWPDQTQQPVPPASLNITGLSTTTMYVVYPVFNVNLNMVQFVQVSGGLGSPPAAYPVTSAAMALAAQAQISDGMQPLSQGGLKITTGSGGGSGGGSDCIHEAMMVKTRERDLTTIGTLSVGEHVLTPDGEWTEVTDVFHSLHDEFVRLNFGPNVYLDVTPNQTIAPLNEGFYRPARQWRLSDVMEGPKESVIISRSVEKMELEGHGVLIHCHPYHKFLVGFPVPFAAMHNVPFIK